MAQDGSLPLAWASSSPLMQPGFRRPGMGDMPSYSYAQQSHEANAHQPPAATGGATYYQATPHAPARLPGAAGGDRVGTWNGPAPRGYVGKAAASANGGGAAAATAQQMHDNSDIIPAEVDDEKDIMISTGARMPILSTIVSTGTSEQAIQTAIKNGVVHFEISATTPAIPNSEGMFFTTVAASAAELTSVLKAHKLDAVDLMLVPAPSSVADDAEVDAVWAFAADAVKASKAKAVGLTGCDAPVLTAFARRAIAQTPHAKVAVARFATSPHKPMRMMMGLCNRMGAAPIATNPVLVEETSSDAVKKVAARAGKDASEVVLRWQLQRGASIAMPAEDAGQLSVSVFRWAMSDNEKRTIDALGK